MVDSVSKETRSKIMRSIKSRNTKLEKKFCSSLLSNGISVSSQPKDVYGKPDFVIRRAKVAIFLDSCFWHGCPEHCRMPRSNIEYWQKKIARNKERDIVVKEELERKGWLVLRIWEHSLLEEDDFEAWTEKISKLIVVRTSP